MSRKGPARTVPPGELAPSWRLQELPDLEFIAAVAAEMWGPVKEPRHNHGERLAKLVGVTPERIRQIRKAGIVPPRVLQMIRNEWRHWRKLQAHRRREQVRQKTRAVQQKARAERLRAIEERGVEAVKGR